MPHRPRPGPPNWTPYEQKVDGYAYASEALEWIYIPAVAPATEYLYLDGRIVCTVTVDATHFSGALSSADDTLQKALETLDAHPGVAGPTGPTGPTGPAGSSPQCVTTADYVVPDLGGEVTVAVTDSTWMLAGMTVAVALDGTYVVDSTPSTTSVKLVHWTMGIIPEGDQNAAPAQIVLTAATGPTGPAGPTGPSGTSPMTTTTASYVSPDLGGDVTISVSSTAMMVAGMTVVIEGDGTYIVDHTISGTQFLGVHWTLGSYGIGDTVPSGRIVSLAVTVGPTGPTGPGLYLTGIGSSVGGGYLTLSRLASGALYNYAYGYGAGETITTGDFNIAIGYLAMHGSGAFSCTSQDNIAIGQATLTHVSNFGGNVGIGNNAGNLLTGANNVAIGNNAAAALTTGQNNVAIGTRPMGMGGTTGSGNVAIGLDALDSPGSTSADNSVAIGTNALVGVTTADGNVGIGYNAGATITTGSNNVAIGVGADCTAAGSNNVAIGHDANASGASNCIQIGYGTNINASDCQIGGSSNSISCRSGGWGAYSDVRLKKDIEPLDHAQGLGLIQALRPVQYKMKSAQTEWQQRPKYGLIAQEVEATMASLGLGPHSVYNDTNPNEWTLEYDQFIAPLVKAVQQLAERVAALESQLAKKP